MISSLTYCLTEVTIVWDSTLWHLTGRIHMIASGHVVYNWMRDLNAWHLKYFLNLFSYEEVYSSVSTINSFKIHRLHLLFEMVEHIIYPSKTRRYEMTMHKMQFRLFKKHWVVLKTTMQWAYYSMLNNLTRVTCFIIQTGRRYLWDMALANMPKIPAYVCCERPVDYWTVYVKSKTRLFILNTKLWFLF